MQSSPRVHAAVGVATRSARIAAQATKQNALKPSVPKGRISDPSGIKGNNKRVKTDAVEKAAADSDDNKSDTGIDSRAEDESKSDVDSNVGDEQERLAGKKWKSWSQHANATPFPDFGHPPRQDCEKVCEALCAMHNDAVEKEFEDPDTPDTIPVVLDAIIVAVLSQATSWSNAKRAMKGLRETYGSMTAYD